MVLLWKPSVGTFKTFLNKITTQNWKTRCQTKKNIVKLSSDTDEKTCFRASRKDKKKTTKLITQLMSSSRQLEERKRKRENKSVNLVWRHNFCVLLNDSNVCLHHQNQIAQNKIRRIIWLMEMPKVELALKHLKYV